MSQKPSFIIRVFGFFHIIQSLLVIPTLTMIAAEVFGDPTGETLQRQWRFLSFFLILTILGIVIGYGLLRLKEWARKGAIYLAIFKMIFTTGFLLLSRMINPASLIQLFVISPAVIYVFRLKNIKSQFCAS